MKKRILLTGATGFLGGEIVKYLSRAGHSVYCLVRSIERAADLTAMADVHLIEGDITLPHCGVHTNLTFDLFIHCAADVRFDATREEYETNNIIGTTNFLELAAEVGKQNGAERSAFFYISTAYTLGGRNRGREMLYPNDSSYTNLYEWSKICAEHEVWSRRDTFSKVAIFRPSIIVGDSRSGEANSSMTLYYVMRLLDLQKRRWQQKRPGDTFTLPYVPGATVNFVPVDYCARAISAAVDADFVSQIFHLTNSNPPTYLEGMQVIRERLGFSELHFQPLSSYEPTAAETALIETFAPLTQYVSRHLVFQDENTRQLLEATGTPPLTWSHDMLRRIVFGNHAVEAR